MNLRLAHPRRPRKPVKRNQLQRAIRELEASSITVARVLRRAGKWAPDMPEEFEATVLRLRASLEMAGADFRQALEAARTLNTAGWAPRLKTLAEMTAPPLGARARLIGATAARFVPIVGAEALEQLHVHVVCNGMVGLRIGADGERMLGFFSPKKVELVDEPA